MRKVKRILHLHRCLLRGYPVLNAEGWAGVLKVDVRTVLRDLKGVEREFGVKPIYDGRLRGYRYRDSDRQILLEKRGQEQSGTLDGDSISEHLQSLAKYWQVKVFESGPHRILIRVLNSNQRPHYSKLFRDYRFLGGDSLEVRVDSPEELVNWVLGCSGVQLLAPPEWVREVCHRAEEALKRHHRLEFR